MSDDPNPNLTRWMLLSVLAWVVHVSVAGSLTFRALTIGPRYQMTYDEYNLKLPAMSETVFSVTRSPTALHGLVFAGLTALDLGILLALAYYRERTLWVAYVVVVLLLLLLLGGWVEVAIVLPEWKLREALSK